LTNRRLKFPAKLKMLCGSEEGASLIELALSMSFFTLLLLGAAELGIVIYASVEVSNGARAACQYGAMNGGTGAPGSMDTAGMLNAANADAVNLPLTSPLTFSTGYPAASCTCSNGVGTSTCTPGDCPGAQIQETVTVKLQTTVNPGIHLPGLPTTFTLYGYDQELVLH
jgi:Flp pilus assembly protein TadG